MRHGNSIRTRNGLAKLEANAAVIARTLKLLANELRLSVLWRLAWAGGELPVGTIAANLGIGQSALSQHLAKLRKNGVITARRVGHEIFYRITDTKAAALMIALQEGDLGDGENNISIPRHMTPNNVAPRQPNKRAAGYPLSGAKRTWLPQRKMSANDATRTSPPLSDRL